MHSITMPDEPQVSLSVRDLFGIDSNLQVKAFAERLDYVPEIDEGVSGRPCSRRARLAHSPKFVHRPSLD